MTLDAIMMGLIVITTVIGLPAVGVVLMAALLIIPAVSARFWIDNLRGMVVLSGGIGLLTGLAGTWLSSRYDDLPAGAVIVLSGAALFVVSVFVAPKKGIFARAFRRLGTGLHIAEEHLLRAFFEIEECREVGKHSGVSIQSLIQRRSWSVLTVRWLLWRSLWSGDVKREDSDGWCLSRKGRERAADVVRRHRLWEIFLVEQASIAPDHVDRDADELEHLLTDEMIQELERKHMGDTAELPASVHPVEQD